MRRLTLALRACVAAGALAAATGASEARGASLLGLAQPATGEIVVRDCAWQRNDPLLVNALYPDAGAIYFTLRLPVVPGVRLRLHGRFPHARYMSLVSYNGLPVDALLDQDVAPDPGSSNPFVPGSDRTASRRSWTVDLLPAAPPAHPGQRRPNALYVGGGQLPLPPAVLQVIYRIYLPDAGRGATGGVPLPEVRATVPAGLRADLRGLTCPNAREALAGSLLQGVQDAYANLSVPLPMPALPTIPDPPQWSVQSGLTAALLGLVGLGDLVTGGPASNPHNRYLAASVARGHGQVLAIRGRAPKTPSTQHGEPVMGSGDLRYWSFCQNSRSTRYVACVADADVALDDEGFYTIAISDPAWRPRTARTWLPFGPEPDGQVLLRHMLPSPQFLPRSAQGVAASGLPAAEAMGDYFPRAAYCSRERFDRDACGLR